MSIFSRVLLPLFLLLCACSPVSVEDYRREGEAITRKLVEELREIHSLEELEAAAPRLEEYFDDLVDVMIEARERQLEVRESTPWTPSTTNEELRQQLNRLYRMGGRQILEDTERGPLLRLNHFETQALG